ncbi:PAAR-like domain-containing protein [Photobacterium nomapromontoriensis]|uniref:PAAR-like domain-containing protein n=1 Tax=Photobacterium nomapromontoriensis TaxID=2910237 RepID=UPI003D0C3FF4
MAVTVCADGLSVIHKGSGGEANATLPDVCLTTVGTSVVPIPYGNNAKSADLTDGTTTVVADGGNSIAIKGCKFSKSTGDAGGDKKGVSSGTIEAEAEFITASPTVKIEGKGVCRLSDQMTMNKANTMCLGGAQNPSVSVAEDKEGTYTIDIHCRYPDSEPLKNAKFVVEDPAGSQLAKGQLDDKGKASVSGLPNTSCKVVYQEDVRPYQVKKRRPPNPHKKDICDDEFFVLSAKEKLPFWLPRSVNIQRDSWGFFDVNISTDPDFRDMVGAEIRAYVELDLTNQEVQYLSEQIIALLDNDRINDEHVTVLIGQVAPLLDSQGEVIHVLTHIHPEESKHNLVAVMRHMGYGDPQAYLDEFCWDDQKNQTTKFASEILERTEKRLKCLQNYASIAGYPTTEDIISKQFDKVSQAKRRLPDQISKAITLLKEKTTQIQNKGQTPTVVLGDTVGHATPSRKINDVVQVRQHLPTPLVVALTYDDMEKTPVSGIPYKVQYANGELFEGWLNGQGKALIHGVPDKQKPHIEFGKDEDKTEADANIESVYQSLDSETTKLAQELVKQAIARNLSRPQPDPELVEQLKALVDDELAELRARKAEFNHASFVEQGWAYGQQALNGVVDGVVNYIPDFGEIGDILNELDIDPTVLIDALVTGDIDELQRALQNIDRAKIGLQQASESMEAILLIISDEKIREYLLQIPVKFLDAIPQCELAKIAASQLTQKGIDLGMVWGGSAATTAGAALLGSVTTTPIGGVTAAGATGPATFAALTGIAVARSGGKALEPLMEALNRIVKLKKKQLNRHKKEPEDKETNLPKICPICHDSKCKNRKRLKPGKGNNNRGNYDAVMKRAYRKIGKVYPNNHDWYVGEGCLEVHHVIPVQAVNQKRFKTLFDNFSYDINEIHNLVVLPGKMALACELYVQRHQGNHSQGMALNLQGGQVLNLLTGHEQHNRHDKIKNFNNKLFKNKKIKGDDFRYPMAARKQVLDLKRRIEKGVLCDHAGNQDKLNEMFEHEMKKHSKKILGYIQDFTWTIAYDGRDYRDGGPGCSNVSTIKNKRQGLQRANICDKENRDHGFNLGQFTGTLQLGK